MYVKEKKKVTFPEGLSQNNNNNNNIVDNNNSTISHDSSTVNTGDCVSSSSASFTNSIYNTMNETDHEESILSALKEKFKQARFNQLSSPEYVKICDILQGRRTNQVLIKKFNIPMTRAKISCLRPEAWLNDEVINFCMSMLEERDIKLSAKYPSRKKSHYFNSFFMEKLLGPGHKKYAYKDVQRWTNGIDIFELDKVFIPINISQTHWTLAVVFIQQKEIHYYDSMNGDGTKYKDALLKWLIDEARKKNSTFDASEWKLKSMKDCPQQLNGFDCGVFTIMCANFLTDNLPILETSYGQRNMSLFRLKIACDILRGSYDYPIE
jgi:sentrin-specific protease 1